MDIYSETKNLISEYYNSRKETVLKAVPDQECLEIYQTLAQMKADLEFEKYSHHGIVDINRAVRAVENRSENAIGLYYDTMRDAERARVDFEKSHGFPVTDVLQKIAQLSGGRGDPVCFETQYEGTELRTRAVELMNQPVNLSALIKYKHNRG